MALKKSIVTEHGFQAVDAYHRVEAVFLVDKTQIRFHVRSYMDPEKTFFAEQIMTASYEIDDANPIKQAYAHLKTLPEFSGATDC